MSEPLLSISALTIKFNLRGRVLTAVRDASLSLYQNEVLAIVGESGSGKSVLTKAIIGMTDKNGWIESGSICLGEERLSDYHKEAQWIKVRGRRISMVFQDPMTALDPLKQVGDQIAEMILLSGEKNKKAAAERAVSLMRRVGIPQPELRYHAYPHEFSGGMRQRIVIATAVASNPQILICDEPTTALDVTLQAQILELIRALQREMGMAVIFITHDLGVVANIADRVAVMYAGEVVEEGTVSEVFSTPCHPYTRALLCSLPQLGEKGKPLRAIRGTPPNLFYEVKGDAFAPRNPEALKIDYMLSPGRFQVSPTHYAKTWTLHEYAIEKYGFPAPLRFSETDAAGGQEKPAGETLLRLNDVSVIFGRGKKAVRAVDHVSFDVKRGETFCLVGESGSGKTTIGRAIMKIIPLSGGSIEFGGETISRRLSSDKTRRFHQRAQMIFQDPMASLNERAKVDYIVSEGLYNFGLFKNEAERRQKVSDAMREVGLLPEYVSRFPHEFSGGQRQRLGIARALIMNPEFVIADEPISALDVSIRAQIINLLNKLKQERGLTYLFIAHDLSVVRFIADRIAVIYKGRIVELADSEALFMHPMHAYTRALLSAIPVPDPEKEKHKTLVRYLPPSGEDGVPALRELCQGHFVWATENEIRRMRKEING